MYTYQRTIFLRETDATGVLYFSELFKLALEAMEVYFNASGFKLQQLIEKSDFLLPIVHSEADFSLPIRVGDTLEMQLTLEKMGTSSFTLTTHFQDPSRGQVGRVSIVHVSVSKETGKPVDLPDPLKQLLMKI